VRLTSGAAGAVIMRKPFRLAVTDGSGRIALQEVENTGQLPTPAPPTPDPGTASLDGVAKASLYAPLSFTIGSRKNVQQPGLTAGNQLVGIEGGTQFSARDVVDAQPAGDGVRVTVATSDPSGRQLVVTVAPDGSGAIRVHVQPTSGDGVASMSDSFASATGEAFHGFGGRHNAIDQSGRSFYNWIEQENIDPNDSVHGFGQAPGTGGDRALFPNGPTAAYYIQSLFYSSRGYGFLLSQPEISQFRMDSDRPDAWQVQAAAPHLDFTIAPGPLPAAVKAITSVSGRQQSPPSWALGPQTTRLVTGGEDAATYEKQVREDLAQIDRTHIPFTAYDLFGWQLLSRQTDKNLINEFHKRGIHVLGYFKGFVDQANYYDEPGVYDTAVNNGYVATLPDGKTPYVYPGLGGSAVIDFTKPTAIAWWKGRLREALDMGFDGWMEDFGEQVLSDMQFSDGATGDQMHNRFPVVYHGVSRQIVADYESQHPGRQIWTYTRSGYSSPAPDQAGSASIEGGNFPGDNNTSFSRSNGLGSMASDMLNRAVGGAFGYTTDVGGYLDLGSPATTKELLIRWAQAAALSPFMRLHNTQGAGTQQPWAFDAETVRLYTAAAKLHQSVQPLIAKLWSEADTSGLPPTRPLWLQFPTDAQAAQQDQEWMLGPDVLVAPVVTQGAETRSVYFPAGCWQSPESGELHKGPIGARVAAPLARLPFFFRCDTNPPEEAASARGSSLGASLGLPTITTCKDRRLFRFGVHSRRGRIVTAFVYVNGRLAKTYHGRDVRRVALTRLPKGHFVVRVVAITRRGGRIVSTRTYNGCVKSRPRSNVRPRPHCARRRRAHRHTRQCVAVTPGRRHK